MKSINILNLYFKNNVLKYIYFYFINYFYVTISSIFGVPNINKNYKYKHNSYNI